MFYFLLFNLFFNPLSFANSQIPSSQSCDGFLLKAEFLKKITLGIENGKLKFSKENSEYFLEQRNNLRNLVHFIHNQLFEVEHATKRLLLAELLGTHAYIEGEPGGAKTELTRILFNRPENNGIADLTHPIDTFSIQLNQLMGDAPLTGFFDPTAIRNGVVTEKDIHNGGTMVHFKRTVIDEIDKGNPAAFAALLDVLNEKIRQYGPLTIKVRTQTIVATSNMSVYDFLKVFGDQAMESTGRALLDRLPFKIYMHNWITNDEDMIQMQKNHDVNQKNSALELLTNPEKIAEIYHLKTEVLNPKHSAASISVDLDWLGILLKGAFQVQNKSITEDQVQITIKEINSEMRKAFYQMRRKSIKESQENPFESNRKASYYPPTIFSNRNVVKYSLPTIKASLFLDLLLLPEEKLPTEKLIQLIENEIPIDRTSTWRLQDVILTAAPGDGRLTLKEDGSGDAALALEYGPEIDKLLSNSFDDAYEVRLLRIKEERHHFNEIYKERMKAHRDNSVKVARMMEELSKILGIQKFKTKSIEEILMLLKQ